MNFDTVNRTFDLQAYASRLTELRRSGAWLIGPCPFCGGTDRFTLKQGADGWRWFCRQCGDGKYHTAVDFAQRLFAGEPLPAAVQRMTGADLTALPAPRRPAAPKVPAEKSRADDLQPAWKNVIDYGQNMLWSPAGATAREYLYRRGLNDSTLHSVWYRLGWSEGRKIDGVWVDRGILLPCFRLDRNLGMQCIDYIKIRRLPQESWKFQPDRTEKYRKLTGGEPGIYGYHQINVDVVVVTEGEFDTLVLFQEAGDLVGACTLGSASERLDVARWGLDLLPINHILTVYDSDEAGRKGADAWGSLGGRVKRARVPPPHKDINDFFSSRGDLAGWVMDTMQVNGILTGTFDAGVRTELPPAGILPV